MELMACKQAILFAATNHFVPAMIEIDAQVVAQQLLQQSAFNLSALGRIYEEVGILLHNHPTIKVHEFFSGFHKRRKKRRSNGRLSGKKGMSKGTQQFVHTSCLDHWRSVKEGFAFSHCTTCKAQFHLQVE
ncbi:hypothetical protein ACLB2K_068037 [Fragaria x ananassa]